MSFSFSRVLGGVRRRQFDLIRGILYRYFSRLPIQPTVLFQSFEGKVVGDSPLAIFLEIKSRNPNCELLFTTNSKTLAPEGARGVRFGSLQWLKALAQSRLLVNNNLFPEYFAKRPGQTYIQTWHGTPLKRLGRDILGTVASSRYQTLLEREASFWDFLISPSPYCSDIFPGSFGFSGPILETGYPRNDLLTNELDNTQSIRQALGISDPKQLVVLYAPTWRDDQRTAVGDWKPVNFLSGELGSLVTVLFRGHTNTHGAHNSSVAKGAIDVTDYPNVAELYLAADVLVTDYSSSMFDFSVTGKPMIFLTPDIDTYSSARGFYFDFESLAPGPILRTGGQLSEALENLESLRQEYSARYQAWREKFNPNEDGLAARRVVDQSRPAFHSLFSEH